MPDPLNPVARPDGDTLAEGVKLARAGERTAADAGEIAADDVGQTAAAERADKTIAKPAG